tara:strand:+ start:534 stop:1868 length:1335 start_codon:yes stop_codon:yes gene_type:complete
MNNFKTLFILVFLINCSKNFETNLPVKFSFNSEFRTIDTYGGSNQDIAHSIIKTYDGGFAVIGNTKSNDKDLSFRTSNDSDILFLKFQSDLKLDYIKTYGGSDDDRGYDLVQLEDGGFILLGYSKSSDGDASLNKGQHDNWIIRIDQKGEIIWEKSFGFSGHDHAYNIISTIDGGFFFNGFLDVTASNGLGMTKKKIKSSKKHGVGEFWCHKIDKNGNLQWRKYFGGSNNDRSYDAIQTIEGDFIIVGTSESNDFEISNSKGSYDMWVIKLDNSGNLLWEKSFGGKGYDGGNAVIENSYGNIMILGQTNSLDNDITDPLGSSDFFLVNMTKKGEILNIENLGTSNFDSGKSIMELDDGSHYLLGNTTDISSFDGNIGSDILFIKTLPNGVFLENQTIGGSGTDIGYDFTQISDGSIIMVGSTDSEDGIFFKNNGKEDVFIVKWN